MSDLSWPPFLNMLDNEPEKAFELFYRYAYRELTSTPPRPMRALGPDDQQDLLQDIILHCVKDEFRILRQYKDVGKSFGGWLYRVAHNMALEHMRKHNRKWPMMAESNDSEDERLIEKLFANPGTDERGKLDLSDLISMVRKTLKEIGNHCRLLLELASDEFTPKEMAAVLFPGKDMNKKISDDLRYCRTRLRDLLATRGVVLEEFI